MNTALAEIDAGLAALLTERADRIDVQLVDHAYRYGAAAHRGQKRASGEDFISHSVAVARILVEHQMDSVSIAAALLHDVVEDADVTVEDIHRHFGGEVSAIVDGLTKISHLQFQSTAEEQVENYRKLMLSIASDARVIIVKLADRLHNMRTLEHLSSDRQRKIARETREIYGPLAHRFGMAGIRSELEDLAFKFLEPDDYAHLSDALAELQAERDDTIRGIQEPLVAALDGAGIENFEVVGRLKHLWSIHKKMLARGKPLEEMYDLMAFRVLVDTVPDCYQSLGVIHHQWTPLHERIKDYIAQPKSNGYHSLHTTIFGPDGRLYEVQIRTREMHRTAEYGIAAHWVYKEQSSPDELDRHLTWFRQLIEIQDGTLSPEEALEILKIDLYQDEIFVFTPMGDVKRLPAGATPIDFAFAVHTEVGLRTRGAKVNGRISPLHRPLRNGESVEILVGKTERPSRDWLVHARTGRARQQIQKWINHTESEQSIALGRQIITRELRRRRLEVPEDEALALAGAQHDYANADDVLEAVGRGSFSVRRLIRALYPNQDTDAVEAVKPNVLSRVIDRVRVRFARGVRIEGADGLMVRYAQCCQPVPGESVTGVVTDGEGISIHRVECPELLTLPDAPDRRVSIDWKEVEGEVYEICFSMRGEDRRGLYADVMQAISGTGTNIVRASLGSRDGEMFGTAYLEIENAGHLAKTLKAMRKVKGVATVDRCVPQEDNE